MSEYLTSESLAADCNGALDKVLPYQPYERTALDIVLVEEAELVSNARVKHLYETFDEQGIQGSLNRSLHADVFYDEHYSGIDWHEDASLLGLSTVTLSGPQRLFKYGSDEVRKDTALQFANEYNYSANKAILNCVQYRLTIHQAEDYLKAVHNFTKELHSLGHLSTDHMLFEPFVNLGNSLAGVLLEEAPDFEEKWPQYLSDEVLGTEDLVGEDGTVGQDMTTSMWSWIENRVLDFKELGGFRKPPAEYCYGYESDELEADEQDEFSAYGSDAPYFREIKRRRIGLEKAKTGSIQ